MLSHAAGVGQPMPVPIARLMIALKLASLAQGPPPAWQAATVRLLEALLAKGLTPVIPCQGSVGASGDLAPLAHMAAAMIGIGEIFVGDQRVPATQALAEAALVPLVLARKRGWRCSTARNSRRRMRWQGCSRRRIFSARPW